MNIQITKLIPIGILSSLGAPVLYVSYAIVTNVIANRSLDALLLITMFGAAMIFSLVTTMGLVLITIGIARFLQSRMVNVTLTSIIYLLGISTLIIVVYGFERGLMFVTLALPNAVIFFVLSRNT